MPAFLLAWNPKLWNWTKLPEVVSSFEAGRSPIQRWSCGKAKHISEGDHVFLIRLVEEPRGIFGFGTVVRGSYEDAHWGDESKKVQYVDFQVDWITSPLSGQIIPREVLDESPFSSMHWDTQMSGVRIPDEVATALRSALGEIDPECTFSLPDELDAPRTYSEGMRRSVVVNSFERSPRARQKCIAHYGARCVVCGFDFGEVYGDVGAGLIHVHHLVPMAERHQSYEVDPVSHLRPVCPNCHAVIHRRTPPYTIDDVKQMLRK